MMVSSTTSSNTTTSLLSASPTSLDPLSAKVSLISADETTFSVDLCKLAGTSNVFAELLKTVEVDADGGRKLKVEEKKEDVEAYLAAVEKGVCPEGETEWDKLSTMGEKYDSQTVRGVLLKGACLWLGKEPYLAYAAASRLNNKELVKAVAIPAALTAFEAEDEEADHGSDDKGSSQRKEADKLALWRLTALATALFVTQSQILTELELPVCSAGHGGEQLERFWLQAIRLASQNLNPRFPPARTLRKELDKLDYGGIECGRCLRAIQKRLLELDEQSDEIEGLVKSLIDDFD